MLARCDGGRIAGAVARAGGAAPARPPDAAHGAQAAATGDESPAAQARRTGRRVEVMAQRSETRVVYANPDGSFTAELHTMPVRVRRGDGWVPVDTTLRARPDGTVGPVATVTPLALSRGGTAPLARIGDAEAQVEIGWPGALPVPTLRGPTATYPDVCWSLVRTQPSGRRMVPQAGRRRSALELPGDAMRGLERPPMASSTPAAARGLNTRW